MNELLLLSLAAWESVFSCDSPPMFAHYAETDVEFISIRCLGVVRSFMTLFVVFCLHFDTHPEVDLNEAPFLIDFLRNAVATLINDRQRFCLSTITACIQHIRFSISPVYVGIKIQHCLVC